MQEIRYEQLSPPEKRFVDHLEDKPNYGKEKEMGQFGPKDQALKSGHYIQFNRAKHFYVGVDLDYEAAALVWTYEVLPAPTIVFHNPESGHANIFWELELPVIRRCERNRYQANVKPLKYFKAIQRAYSELLDGDPGYTSATIKNPFSSRWIVWWTDNVYSLRYLAEFVALKSVDSFRSGKVQDDENYAGRNVELFNVVRKKAYHWVHNCDEQTFESRVHNCCVEYNQMIIPEHWPEDGPLPTHEVATVARNIVRWCLHQKDTGGFKQRLKNHGVMKLEKINPELDDGIKTNMTSCHQAIGAAYTHRVRKQKTEDKIASAIQKVRSENRCVVKKEIAEIAGVSVATLRYYPHLFKNLYQ